MRVKFFQKEKKGVTLQVTLTTPKRELIGLDIYDRYKPNTYYSRTSGYINGKRTFNVRLPLVPEAGYVRIYNTNAKNPDSPEADLGFVVNEFDVIPLQSTFDWQNSDNKKLVDFLKFACKFSERAAYTSAGHRKSDRSIYKSNDGKFQIHYLDEIIGEDGIPRKTSMRVHNQTGIMELSKKYITTYTIPERICILLHEYAHFHLNKEKSDEFEADLNALFVYLSLGFPRKEAITAWHNVFYRTDTDFNVQRMKEIHKFVSNFDKANWQYNDTIRYNNKNYIPQYKQKRAA